MNLSQYFGGERGRMARLARITGLAPGFLSQIATGERKAPAERCASIESASGGMVTRRDLRPDDWAEIWPELVNLDSESAALDEQGG